MSPSLSGSSLFPILGSIFIDLWQAFILLSQLKKISRARPIHLVQSILCALLLLMNLCLELCIQWSTTCRAVSSLAVATISYSSEHVFCCINVLARRGIHFSSCTVVLFWRWWRIDSWIRESLPSPFSEHAP